MSLRVIQSPISGCAQIDGKKVIVLGSNNYRGLANHPVVLAAFHEGLRQYGAGTGMNPPLATTNAHRRLEEALAEFHQAERRWSSVPVPQRISRYSTPLQLRVI